MFGGFAMAAIELSINDCVQGTTGLTGNAGWHLSFDAGAPWTVHLMLKLLPPGQHIMFSARYPETAALTVRRRFRWYASLDATLRRVATQREVLLGDGLQYFFGGGLLLMKLVDPGARPLSPHRPRSLRATRRSGGRRQVAGGTRRCCSGPCRAEDVRRAATCGKKKKTC